MRKRRLSLKKEIVANLSDADLNHRKGGTENGNSCDYKTLDPCYGCASIGSCHPTCFTLTFDNGCTTEIPTSCGGSYCACSQGAC